MKNSRWAMVVIFALFALPPALAGQDAGLVLRFGFNDPYALVATDSSGLGNDGQLTGQVYVQPDSLMGGAANFYGPSGAITVPYSPSLEPATGTLQVWVRVANRQDASVVMKLTDLMVNRQSQGSRAVYDIHMRHNGAVEGCIADDARMYMWTCAVSRPMTVIPGTWQLFTLRWDGSTVSVFVDGNLQAAVSYTAIRSIGLSYHGRMPLVIGVYGNWGPQYGEFCGEISGVELFSRPLAESGIAATYAARMAVLFKAY